MKVSGILKLSIHSTLLIFIEYKIWKKNVPFLYDFFSANALESPSPFVQWLPKADEPLNAQARYSTHRLFLGTHGPVERLVFAELDLPTGPFSRPPIVPAHAKLTGVLSSVAFNTTNAAPLSADAATAARKFRIQHAYRHYNPTDPAPAFAALASSGGATLNTRNPAQFAAFATHGDIVVYNVGKDPAATDSAAQLVLVGGHSVAGSALDWATGSATKPGSALVSGAADGSVALWDVNASPAVPPIRRRIGLNGDKEETLAVSINTPVPVVQPVAVAEQLHAAAVTAVAWDPHIASVFGTASADGSLCIVDTRTSIADPVARVANAHVYAVSAGGSAAASAENEKPSSSSSSGGGRGSRSSGKLTPEPGSSKRGGSSTSVATPAPPPPPEPEYISGAVNSLAFNPHNEYVLATAGADGEVHVWDMRMLGEPKPVFALNGHVGGDAVVVRWSPHHESVLASGGLDRRVLLWDLARVDVDSEDGAAGDLEDGPPELLFMHGGHTAPIADVAWHPTVPWVVASACEDNIVQVWKPADHVTAVTEAMFDGGETEAEEED